MRMLRLETFTGTFNAFQCLISRSGQLWSGEEYKRTKTLDLDSKQTEMKGITTASNRKNSEITTANNTKESRVKDLSIHGSLIPNHRLYIQFRLDIDSIFKINLTTYKEIGSIWRAIIAMCTVECNWCPKCESYTPYIYITCADASARHGVYCDFSNCNPVTNYLLCPNCQSSDRLADDETKKCRTEWGMNIRGMCTWEISIVSWVLLYYLM